MTKAVQRVPRRSPALFDVTGRVAVVTGGGSGLGRQMAFGLAEAGAAVVVCGRRVERCEAVADQLRGLGMKSLSVRCDVTDAAQVEALVDTTVEQFGSLDVLVNSAGTTWAAPAASPADR